jgi:flagellar motor switch protein FliN/FliY
VSLSDDLQATGDIAFVFASALEQELGDDALMTVGVARTSIGDVIADDQVRVIALHFGFGPNREGSLAFVAPLHFAETVERAASDELLLTGVAPALDAAVQALAAFDINVEPDEPHETTLAVFTGAIEGNDVVAYPLLVGTDPVACFAVAVCDNSPSASARAPGTAQAEVSAINAALPGAAGTSNVLADVEMGVTAELGRCNMTVRELLSLTPGAVIDLDRAAGALVDVLVNGTLIARGEVVVVDEEFGIRIAEILRNGAPAQ